jgi:hypothetical protein
MLIFLSKTATFIIYSLLLQSLLYMPSSQAEEILIYIRDDVYEDYLKFVDGRNVLTIENFSGKNIRRDVVDMIIAQQALKIGGFDYSFDYAPGKLNFRNTRMLELGRLLISFDSYWLSDAKALKDSVYISEPIIRQGEYVAGLYTSPNNKKALSVTTLSDLNKLTAVSTTKWRTDWKTLQSLPLKELVQEDEWLSQARMVDLTWVDFILMAFNSTPDQSFKMDKIHLVPVKNIGIELKGSRHFVISSKHPYGKKAIFAINIGIKELRKKNKIVKAYTQAGFFIDTEKITILNK